MFFSQAKIKILIKAVENLQFHGNEFINLVRKI